MNRFGSIIDGCDVGITAASKLRPLVGLGVPFKKEYTDRRAWAFLAPQDALVVADTLHEYAIEGMKLIRTEGGDPSMADIIQPTAPHDPAAGIPEKNLPHASPDESATPAVPAAAPAPPPVIEPNPAAGAKEPTKTVTKDE